MNESAMDLYEALCQYQRAHQDFHYAGVFPVGKGDRSFPLVEHVEELQRHYPDGLLPEPGQQLWAELLAKSNSPPDDYLQVFEAVSDFRAWLVQQYHLEKFQGADPIPAWDAKGRQLSFAGKVCTRYKKAAPNQEKILGAFETCNWPDKIIDPFDGGELGDTICSLQKRLRESSLVIERDGTGKGLRWRPRTKA